MKKIIYFLIIILALGLLTNNALAFESNSLVNLHAPYATFHGGTFDDLVMDFSLITVQPDIVRAMSFRNLGSADNFSHIKYMILWLDQGPLGFQGMGVDKEIGNFDYSSGFKSWYIDNLAEPIEDHLHFYVTVEPYTLIHETATIQMQISALFDDNSNGSFDVGDFGIFLDSGNNGPIDKNLTNNSNQIISDANSDIRGPKIVITNLINDSIINNNNFTINGLIRDQGNHGIKAFAIKINDQLLSVANYNVLPYQWSYDWQDVADGEYVISLQAYDEWGNFTQTEPITVNVLKQDISIANSEIKMSKTTISNSGIDAAEGVIKLKDINNQPIANWPIDFTADPGLFVNLPNNLSDQNGEVFFEVYSGEPGIHNIIFEAENYVLGEVAIEVTELNLVDTDIKYGDLIQGSNKAVYYYGADGKRYVFPNQEVYFSWYEDFSLVKKITDQQLALIPLGGNVTYKPGVCLVKITTDPKVYAVDQGGQLKWVSTETMAQNIYGSNWQTKIKDIADVFFTDYIIAPQITQATDYSPAQLIEQVSSINIDKGLLR